MDNQLIIVNGYLMNVTDVVQYALVHKPIFREMVTDDGFYRCYTEMVRYTEQRIRRECGIKELEVKAVWIGSHNMAFCWTLPDRFLRKNRTEVEETQLKKFKKLARIQMGEPRSYADSDGAEPALLARLDSIPDVVYPLTGIACDENFKSGAISVNSLITAYKMENLNLEEDDCQPKESI